MASANPTCVVLQTSLGDITLELDAEKAPETVANFLRYVDAQFYDGTIFHRVIPHFMIQGGGFAAGLKPKATQPPVKNEAQNGLRNVRGAIAMARTNDPHSATSQFFINVTDNDFLDYPGQDGWGYCVFGKVTAGMDVVDAIRKVATKTVAPHENVPVQDVVIRTARRLPTARS